MIHCLPSDLYKPKFVLVWMLLSLKAGYLNAAGFLATGYFVSHVTGFGTSVGVSLAHSEYFFGIELLVIPIAFIIGSSIPAWVLEWRFRNKDVPKFHLVQFIITALLGLIFLGGVNGLFGNFTTESKDLHDVILIGLLCLTCGMKNGLTTWATSGKIRTTHLTGLSTDIGIHLPKMFVKDWASRFPESRKVNLVRILTFLSFSTGSLLAAIVFPDLQYWGFLSAFIVSTFLSALSYTSYLRQVRISPRRALIQTN